MVNLRPSTAADVAELFGRLDISVIGITATEDERVLGMGAIYPHDGSLLLICKVAPEARKHLPRHAKTMVKGARRLLAIAAQYKLPVRVVADRKYPRAAALIEHLGFKYIGKDVYECQATQQ